MIFVSASNLCQTCACYIPRPVYRNKFIDFSDPTTARAETEFYVYFDPDDRTDKIDVIKGKCPGYYANLRVQTTLEQWKEAGEMAKKSKIGMKIYPSANIRQEVLVSLKDAFGDNILDHSY